MVTANENQEMQVDVAHEAWQGTQVEAALSEADAGDFLPEKEMAEKLNQLGKRNKVEMDGWAQENHEVCFPMTYLRPSRSWREFAREKRFCIRWTM